MARLPSPDHIRALEAAALAEPRPAMTPIEIHALAARSDKIRQIVAELDVHFAEIEANIAVLNALLATAEVPGDEDIRLSGGYTYNAETVVAPRPGQPLRPCAYVAPRRTPALVALCEQLSQARRAGTGPPWATRSSPTPALHELSP